MTTLGVHEASRPAPRMAVPADPRRRTRLLGWGIAAVVVAALREAGAVVAGITNMHELAFGITSNNAVFGPVRNPADPTRAAGGSSGGSAAAVARGDVPVALGTDTGGSVTIPASLCGVVGFRPSTGRWPAAAAAGAARTRRPPARASGCVGAAAVGAAGWHRLVAVAPRRAARL